MHERRRLLVCDDHASIRDLVCIRLHALGYDCVPIETRSELIVALARGCPAGVVLDLSMPGLEATDAIAEVRRHCHRIPLVAFSGSAERREEVLAAGADDFVLKGGPIELLEHAIVKAFGAFDRAD